MRDEVPEDGCTLSPLSSMVKSCSTCACDSSCFYAQGITKLNFRFIFGLFGKVLFLHLLLHLGDISCIVNIIDCFVQHFKRFVQFCEFLTALILAP